VDIGLFLVPFRLPDVGIEEGFEWDMQVIRWADEYGLSEVWVGEHSTLRWEPCCSPELYIAHALAQTSRIKLATGANVPANHNPVALAHRLMQLDMMSKGRLIVGLGAGSHKNDSRMHGTTNPPEMMAEAVEILRKVWANEGPGKFEGKYWQFEVPEYDPFLIGPWMTPSQNPIPIAMAGVSPDSRSLTAAGAQGCIPLSFNVGREYLAGHWYRYVQGAEEAGRTPNRNDWRVASNIFVADTDDEAMELAINGAMGRTYREWLIPSYAQFGMLQTMAPEIPNLTDPDDISVEYLAEKKWLVGTPETVVKKLQADLEASGGFGNIIGFTYDYLDQPEAYRRNLELIGTEVIPRIKNLTHKTEALSALTRPAGLKA